MHYTTLVLLIVSTLYGCSTTTHITIRHNPPQSSTTQDIFMAGISEIDITPPPGLPKAGYAAFANDGMGFRTRLKARVFYLQPKEGEPIAIIQTDLLSGSTVLHHKVAEVIAAKTTLDNNNIAIVATHNHAGPGQFLGSNFYNKFASNRSGFDPKWFDFLVNQITRGVIEAYEQRRPAKIATGKIEVWGLTRNRSFAPYLKNSFVNNKTKTTAGKYKAINPDLFMVRIDVQDNDGLYKPKGVFTTFSIHGTGVPRFTELYNADVWAYISQELEWSIQENYDLPWQPIHGPFEGTHADMAPNERFDVLGYIEAKRVGVGIAEHAWKLFSSLDNKLTADVKLKSALREIDVLQETTINNISLCRPIVGGATAAGADEHRSPIISKLPGIAPEWPRWVFTGSCQGHKRWLGSYLQLLILTKEDFPHNLLFQTLQINDLGFVLLPFEITLASGKYIGQEVAKQASEDIKHIVVSSVANGYTGYSVTPEEYQLQHYEGGHTLYGPQTTPYLAAQSARLFSEMLVQEKVSDVPKQRQFNFNTSQYFPEEHQYSGERSVKTQAEFFDAIGNEEAYWSFQWFDVPPAYINFHESLVYIEYQQDTKDWKKLFMNRRPVNDQGYDIAVIYKDKKNRNKMGLYEVRWYNPEIKGDRQYRFVIAPRDNQAVFYSPAFSY